MQSEKQKLGRTEALHTCQEWGLGTNESATLTWNQRSGKKNQPTSSVCKLASSYLFVNLANIYMYIHIYTHAFIYIETNTYTTGIQF